MNLRAMREEVTRIYGVEKTAGVLDRLSQFTNPGGHLGEHAWELGGLGVLAVPGLDTLQAAARARMAGDASPEAVEHRQLLSEPAHAAADVGGLGILMVPEAITLARKLRGH